MKTECQAALDAITKCVKPEKEIFLNCAVDAAQKGQAWAKYLMHVKK